jgi:hypothetical protein
LRPQSRSLIFPSTGGAHEKVRGQLRGHGAQAQRPLRLSGCPNGRVASPHPSAEPARGTGRRPR